jgi:hypothetical protein
MENKEDKRILNRSAGDLDMAHSRAAMCMYQGDTAEASTTGSTTRTVFETL